MTPDSPKKLFLLDAMALIYRAYFAFSKNPRINSKGFNTSAVLGFTNTLVDVLSKEKPTHIAVAFDTAAPTERHTDFEDYKGHREAMPEDLAASIPIIKDIIRGFRIPVVVKDGFEADDIIGTLAKEAEKRGFKVYMMTPDKDFAQLVSEHIFIYKPPSKFSDLQIMGIPEVLAKFEIQNVDQVRDLLGIWGDAADNIPGIPGFGEKTAKQLLAQFGTIENLIANADQLKDKQRDKVITFADQAILSKKLATIITNVPVEFDETKLIMEEPDKDLLKAVFAEMEFRTLAKRLFGEGDGTDSANNTVKTPKPSKPSSDTGSLFDSFEPVVYGTDDDKETSIKSDSKAHQTIHTVTHQYHTIDTPEKRKELIDNLLQQKIICFDTETTNIDANDAEIVGLSFAYKPHEAYYIPMPENYAEAHAILSEFKIVFEDENIEKVGQNIKYDMTILKWYDITIKGKLFDTMLAHYLIEPDMRHNMNILAETYLDYSPVEIGTLIGTKKSEQLSMRTVAIDLIKEYAAEDADVTLQLRDILKPLLDENKVTKLFEEVEIPLVPVLAAMETEGVAIDKSVLKIISGELEKDISDIEQEIYKASGTTFNIASPRQLGDVLFDVLKIDPNAKMTKTKQYATGEEVLSKLAHKHPVVDMVLTYRELVKLKNTYVDTLPNMINPRTGRVHTSFAQAVAATGRLSSNNPNLQNIPIRTERGREIRKAFISRNDRYILLSSDYSQIELRIIAEVSKDPSMLEAFKNKIDIHTATAAKVYSVSIDAVTKEMRRNAKMVNFGIIYGISAFGLSQRLNIPRKEAASIIDNYFAQYPSIKQYMDTTINFARESGYVETLLGRRRYLRDINSANANVRGFAERNAINAPIQGTAADMIKVAMINIYKDLNDGGFKTKMTLQVHDELVFDVPKEELEIIKPIIEHRMKTALPMTVPIEVEMGAGMNWLEAH